MYNFYHQLGKRIGIKFLKVKTTPITICHDNKGSMKVTIDCKDIEPKLFERLLLGAGCNKNIDVNTKNTFCDVCIKRTKDIEAQFEPKVHYLKLGKF